MLLLAFPPENLITYGDYRHYFNLAALTQYGYFPFIHYWYEFPPIFPYFNIAVYFLAGGQLKNYIVLLAFLLLLVECANLYLLYQLAFLLFGRARATTIAWIYTALFAPVFFWLGNFDALTTFFILLGLRSLLKGKNKLLLAALGVGTAVKFVPIILSATVWRVRNLKTALIYGLGAALIGAIIYLPFAAGNPTFTLASLQAQAGKSSYQTVWALVDGNYTTGNFGPLSNHFDPAKATTPLNNPPLIPTWLTLIPFGLLGLYVLTRPRLLPDPNLDAVILPHLRLCCSFSGRRAGVPSGKPFIPLLLLSLPQKRAVLFIIALGFINFLEWPVILSRGLNQLIPITILARTLILILLGVDLYQRLPARK